MFRKGDPAAAKQRRDSPPRGRRGDSHQAKRTRPTAQAALRLLLSSPCAPDASPASRSA
jgi:hypothetical protein